MGSWSVTSDEVSGSQATWNLQESVVKAFPYGYPFFVLGVDIDNKNSSKYEIYVSAVRFSNVIDYVRILGECMDGYLITHNRERSIPLTDPFQNFTVSMALIKCNKHPLFRVCIPGGNGNYKGYCGSFGDLRNSVNSKMKLTKNSFCGRHAMIGAMPSATTNNILYMKLFLPPAQCSW